MDPLKHECGVALIRLRRPLEYYKQKYGSYTYALDKLYLLMEKQHNRGQEAAGVGVVKLHGPAGYELIFRERALGKDAIPQIFSKIGHEIPENVNQLPVDEVDAFTPYIGQIYMGHLRYSTTGKSGLNYAHPVLRRNNWASRSLMLCGNFNMTNVREMFEGVVAQGQHPRIYSDTNMILEQVGYALDKENHHLYRSLRDTMHDPDLAIAIEDRMDMGRVLRNVAPQWDGGFVMCGATGSGDMFAVRDSHGIRPAFYYYDDEIVVLASERPVIQTVFDVPCDSVKELTPGNALLVNKAGDVKVEEILPQEDNRRCSFERIYFSRGSDIDIYAERKRLGEMLVPRLLGMVDNDVRHTVFSFIPNTAEVAFFGMIQGLERHLDGIKYQKIQKAVSEGNATEHTLKNILSERIRVEKIAIKDVKMRTFIAEGSSRDDMVAHVYDVTYGTVEPGVDTLVAIDDSIVRGTTLRQSILRQLDRLNPRRIIIVSSSPQVRYPDYYGIDMSALDQFIAFHAAIMLLMTSGRGHIVRETYEACLAQRKRPYNERTNCVKAIYAPFTDDEITAGIVTLLIKDASHPIKAKVDILYQTLEDMHKAIPGHPGDWYFSGNYPTPGGNRLVNEAFIDFYERNRLDLEMK
ncbi:MAG: amidophosphoribosyltransferase [Muribaculaceae bacterium]|nr:amidophosphoribosyltransferase [Muribaculaceae bacterium]